MSPDRRVPGGKGPGIWTEMVGKMEGQTGFEGGIALAKVHAPQKISVSVDRDRAFNALKDRLSRRIITVEAPQGFAKTGFLAESYRRLGEDASRWDTAWVAVDGSDDFDRLCRHLVEAWAGIWPDLDKKTLVGALSKGPREFAAQAGNFIMERYAGSCVEHVLFLDDLHLMPSGEISLFLNCVAEYCPTCFHVVASGNHMLWELVDIRFRDLVEVFPAELLSFSLDEVEQILKNTFAGCEGGSGVAPDVVSDLAASLLKETRGWPLAVRSYADALAKGIIEPSRSVDMASLRQLLNRFFHDVILEPLPEKLKGFLAATSVADRICPEFCDELLGIHGSRGLIRELRQGGCLIRPYPGETGWYEYHPLMLSWLRRRQGLMDPDKLNALCMRASLWFREKGMHPQAAKLLLMSSDADFIENLAFAVGFDIDRGEIPYASWVSRMPEGFFESDPGLALQVAWGYLCAGKADEARHWVDVFRDRIMLDESRAASADIALQLVDAKCLEMECRYEEAFAAGEELLSQQVDLSLQQKCLVMQTLGEACLRIGRFDDAQRYLLQAEVMAELQNSALFAALSRIALITMRFNQGHLQEAYALACHALDECPAGSSPHSLLLSLKGQLLMEMNRVDEAARCISEAHRLAPAVQNSDMALEASSRQATFLAFAGQGALAFRIITKAVYEVGESRIPRSVNLLVNSVMASVALSLGYFQEARSACGRMRAQVGKLDAAYSLTCFDLEFALEDAEGPAGPSSAVVPLVEEAQKKGLGYLELRLCIRAALRLAGEGARAQALLFIGRALKLQVGERIAAPFIQAGQQMRSLLHEIVDVRKSGGQIHQLAKMMLRESSAEDDQAADAKDDMATRYGLTDREVEVLELLDAGLSRKEIAESLVVSVNTVKSHVSSIYTKLHVKNRVDAFSVVHSKD